MPDAESPTSLRLFVAIELSDAWRAWVRRVADELRPALGDAYRWVRPDLLHLTVCFLGPQTPDRLPAITRAVDAAARAERPFPLAPGHPGGFGGRRPRVIWVGAEDRSGALQRLRDHLDTALDREAIPFDRKPLVPHITIARPKPGAARLPSLPTASQHEPAPLQIRHITLVNSHLSATGPRYEIVRRASLPVRGANARGATSPTDTPRCGRC